MRNIAKALVVVYILGCFLFSPVQSAASWNINDEIIKANEYIENEYGFVNFYDTSGTSKIRVHKDDQNKTAEIKVFNIIENLATAKERTAFPGNAGHPEGYPIFLYGSSEEATKEYFRIKGSGSPAGSYSELNKEWRTLGFTNLGCPFPNPWFPNDYYNVYGKEVANYNDKFKEDKVSINVNKEYSDDANKYWIKDPYDLHADGNDVRDISKQLPNSGGKIAIDVSTANMIKSWVRIKAFRPDKINDRKLLSKLVVNPPKSVKDNFEDYLAVLSPPTDNSWGIGVAFYYKYVDGGLTSRYSVFYLKPKSLLKNDLYAQFEYEPSFSPSEKIKPGDKVKVGISIDSLSKIALKGVGYKIKVTKDSGEAILYETELPADIAATGDKMDIPASWAKLYVSFIMPESPVNIGFSINEDGKNPEEDILTNNIITAKLLPLKIRPFDLNYNILTRKVKYRLEDFDIAARLKLPQWSWNGNATGSLGVTAATTDLLRDFSVSNNPAVDEANETIIRNPEIHTTFYRKDFGDDPQNNKWFNHSPLSEPKTRFGDADYKGTVSRPYSYKCESEDCDG